jgi:hypothetical protein
VPKFEEKKIYTIIYEAKPFSLVNFSYKAS